RLQSLPSGTKKKAPLRDREAPLSLRLAVIPRPTPSAEALSRTALPIRLKTKRPLLSNITKLDSSAAGDFRYFSWRNSWFGLGQIRRFFEQFSSSTCECFPSRALYLNEGGSRRFFLGRRAGTAPPRLTHLA